MDIIEHGDILPADGKAKASVYGLQGELTEQFEDDLISEYVLLIFVNSRLAYKAVCTPTDLPDLVVGRLITEAGIDPSDIKTVDVCINGNAAKVTVSNGFESGIRSKSFNETLTCCTDNLTLLDSNRDLLRIPDTDIDLTGIPALLAVASEDTALHKLTGSSHSALLMYEGKVIYKAEDIGRHNAIDKAVGYLYRNGLQPSKAILYTTGRMPTDMIRKAIRAKIPVLVSRQKPTVEGVKLASDHNLMIIGHLRSGNYRIYGK